MNQRRIYDVTVTADERLQLTHVEITEALSAAIDKKLRSMSVNEVPRSGESQIDVVSVSRNSNSKGVTDKIVSVTFQDSDRRNGDKEANAIMTDGAEEFVLAWFSDELSFTEGEFVGRTIEEARDLKEKKDISYLQT